MKTAYVDSDKELTGYFTSHLGLGAQSYDDAGGTALFDSDKAIARFFVGPMPEQIRTHRAVEWALERIERRHFTTLRLRYYPQRIGSGPYQTALGALAALGLETDVAQRAFAKWQSLSPKRLDTSLVQWLDDEATSGQAVSRAKAMSDAAEARLSVALASYDAVRIQRERAAEDGREAKRQRERDQMAERLGERRSPPQSATRIRVNHVRPQLRQACDIVRELMAEHADLLAEVDQAS